jgi:hypothetical protein
MGIGSMDITSVEANGIVNMPTSTMSIIVIAIDNCD